MDNEHSTKLNLLFWNLSKNVKVKCTLVQALRLCTSRRAQRGSRGIALPFHDHGTRRGWGVSITPRPLFTPGKTRYPLYRRLGGPQGRSGQVRKISPPTGIRSPDRQTRSQSLYRLSYTGPYCMFKRGNYLNAIPKRVIFNVVRTDTM